MNGIIHNCSHSNNTDLSKVPSESEIFSRVFEYVDMLFRIARPTKVLFIAVDGKYTTTPPW